MQQCGKGMERTHMLVIKPFGRATGYEELHKQVLNQSNERFRAKEAMQTAHADHLLCSGMLR